MRYQGIQEMFTSMSNHRSCITTDIANLLIMSCFAPFCTFLYIYIYIHIMFMVGRLGGVMMCTI
ncbi:hypothetical protein Hanom_Chr03g00215861 [Helianthus anomalus]